MSVMDRTIGYREYKPLVDLFVFHIQTALKENVVSIVLYGSVVRDEAGPESDVDLLLILEEASPVYWRRLQPLLPILRNLRGHPCWKALEDRGIFPSFSVLILSRTEADQNRFLYLDMLDESRILVDREGFFQSRLKALQRRLQELGARRVHRNEGWYWDLKPDLRPGQVVTL